MVTVARRRRPKPQQAAEDNIPESIFDALNLNPPGGEKKEDQERKPAGPTIEDLQKQLGELTSRLEASERANMALSVAPPAAVSPPPKEPTIDLNDLPDPVLNGGKDYAEELARRQTKYFQELQDYKSAKEAPPSNQPNYDQLWEDFAATYPAYVEDQEAIEFATNKVLKQMQRRGIDPNRYMTLNSDRFFKDVTKAYDDRFGKPDQEDEAEDNRRSSPAPSRKQSRADDGADIEANRTGGIFGGLEGSGNSRRPAAPPPGDMVKDLQDIQRKTGYY